jgi:peptidoglycan hydrolase CwlO-like protein
MEKNKKPIDNLREDLQSVIFKVEVIHKEIQELRKLNLDVIAKIEKHQEEIKKIDNDLEQNLKKNKGWFF